MTTEDVVVDDSRWGTWAEDVKADTRADDRKLLYYKSNYSGKTFAN